MQKLTSLCARLVFQPNTEAPSEAAFVPLLEWLRPSVRHMDVAGNYLPTIIELDLLTQPVFQHVSLQQNS